MSSINHSTRHSRLVHPSASRLSFAPSSRLSSSESASFQSVAIQNQPSSNMIANKQQSTLFQHPQQHLELPNANTSGLPAPRQRSTGFTCTTVRPASARASQEPPTSAIPSTVSNALRSRQESSKISSRLPSPACGVSSFGSNYESSTRVGSSSSSSFCIRRSQSQRPTTQLGYKRDTSSNFTAHLRLRNQAQQEPEEEAEDESSKCIQSLPPLKSASYINKLSSNLQSSNSTTSSKVAKSPPEKPSQLVKPLPSSRQTSRSASSNAQSSSESKKIPESRLNTFGYANKANSSSDATGGQQRGRRLSLQHSGYNSINLKLNYSTPEQSTNGDHSEHEEQQSDSEEDNFDDEITTATSMTQTTSESNQMLSKANQELNSMIQMLSSRAILAESVANDANDSVSLSSSSYENGKKKIPKKCSVEQKSKIIKSQSMSFKSVADKPEYRRSSTKVAMKPTNKQVSVSYNRREQTITTTSYQPDSKLNSEPTYQSSKLARPRSRIIFDPTSSQFHVSCTDDALDQMETELSQDSSTDTTNDALPDPLDEEDDDDYQDETSLKLLSTHNQINELKYLSNPTQRSTINNQDLDREVSCGLSEICTEADSN